MRLLVLIALFPITVFAEPVLLDSCNGLTITRNGQTVQPPIMAGDTLQCKEGMATIVYSDCTVTAAFHTVGTYACTPNPAMGASAAGFGAFTQEEVAAIGIAAALGGTGIGYSLKNDDGSTQFVPVETTRIQEVPMSPATR